MKPIYSPILSFLVVCALFAAQNLQAQKYSFELVGVEEIDSLSTDKTLRLAVTLKNTGAFFNYPALRAIVDTNVVSLENGELTSYGIGEGQSQVFGLNVKYLPQGQSYTLRLETHQMSMNTKFDFTYKPKKYAEPVSEKGKKKKAKKEKVKKTKKKKEATPVELKAEPDVIHATPPSPPR